MIILDKPYVSRELLQYCMESQVAVLKNDYAKALNTENKLNLVEAGEFSKKINGGARVYTLSENSLDWVKTHTSSATVANGIAIMKDKYLCREKIATMHPNFYFAKVNTAELDAYEIAESSFPLVLKPVVGFFSAGVYILRNQADFLMAKKDIKESYSKWKELYPASVIGESEFILEEYITGEEYAVDAYFDSKGATVVLNIMAHEFSSETDVSDTLYYTSKAVIEKHLAKLTEYFDKVNGILGLSSFPFHAEVRITEAGDIRPIELNPLRFAGWCCTDLAYFAYGFRTYDYYLNDKRPDWQSLLAGKDNIKYTMIIIAKPDTFKVGDVFDYDAVVASFEKVLCLRKLDYNLPQNPFCFLYTETKASRQCELDNILHSTLEEYITTK